MDETKKYNKKSSCDGKLSHSTELAVQYFLDSAKMNSAMDYYKCKHCGQFHVFTLEGMSKLSLKKQVRNANLRDKVRPKKMRR